MNKNELEKLLKEKHEDEFIVCSDTNGKTLIESLHSDHVKYPDLSVKEIENNLDAVLDYRLSTKKEIEETLEANCDSFLTIDMDDNDKALVVLIDESKLGV